MSVLRIRQALVIGPTPPGTGVIAPASFTASSYATSPTSLFRPSASVRRDPVSAHGFGPPQGSDKNIGTAAQLGQSFGLGMSNRYRAALLQQKLRHRLPDEIGASDDERIPARNVAP